MTPGFAQRQRGAVLLAMLAVFALGASWYLVSRLSSESGLASATVKARNTQVLNKAKQALIGYIAAQAAIAGENRPGALPCPEAPADFNVIGSEGTVSYPCTLPVVGRFPWRTLGLDKLVDASGEPLWYAVATGWAGAATVINSDCASPSSGMACATGRLTVNGVASDVIALIIAPGPAINVSASANCAAWSQTRPTAAPPDWRNYLECENATSPADATFATAGPSGSFNDQVVRITVEDLLPAVEAAIASRIEREIVPALNTAYTPAGWGFAGTKPLYPYAVPFINGATNPGPNSLAGPIPPSGYLGVAGTYQGLLSFFRTQGCNPATEPRCNTTLLAFSKSGGDSQTGGGGYIQTQSSCSWVATEYVCIGEYFMPSISVALTINVTNVAMGLRTFDASKVSFLAHDNCACGGIGTQTVPFTSTVALKADGSATVTVAGGPVPDITASGWGTYANYEVRIDRAAFGDHSLLDTANATTGWFARNEWFRQTYYAVARGFTAEVIASAPQPPACPTTISGSYTFSSSCLGITNVTPANSQRAILIVAGRSINGNARPSSILADYLEFGNRTGTFDKLAVTGAFSNVYTATGAANAYAIAAPVTTGVPFHFKFAPGVVANTGASTFAATAVGPVNLVNTDGSNLTASQIQANAAGEATYDGTRFVLSKRPFNDRVVVVCPRNAPDQSPPVCL